MILPASATVAVIDGERFLLFKNAGHGAPQLAPQTAPTVKAGGGAASEGHRSSAANPDNDTQAEDD